LTEVRQALVVMASFSHTMEALLEPEQLLSHPEKEADVSKAARSRSETVASLETAK
jgi:hypothetical protein